MDDQESHHFVPRWYQRRFLTAERGEFLVLDKSPNSKLMCPDGRLRDIKPRTQFSCGPNKLFQMPGLYSVALRDIREDAIERLIFGAVDDAGARANALFCGWPQSSGFTGPKEDEKQLHRFGHPSQLMGKQVEYMAAQRVRTPKGIAQIKYALAMAGQLTANNNALMAYLLQRRQYDCTVWAEGVWEIFSARNSGTKFLLSDEPVTIYNCDCYPGSDVCRYPFDPDVFWRGSRVLHPLNPNALLVISHVEHVDNPSRMKARRERRNARAYDEVLLNYMDIINEREFNDTQVAKINFAMKSRATRYVASVRHDDLFPEKEIEEIRWSEIDKLFYPRFPSYRGKSEVMIRYKDGTIRSSNAFGERDIVPGWFVRQQEKRRGKKEPE
jgi:hypothetical protein